MPTITFRFLSWNLKDFGNYDYSKTMSDISDTIIESGVDIFVILEVAVNRRVKRAKIDQDLVLSGATNALNSLLSTLKKKDKPSGWKMLVTGANAGNKDRDAYAFYWKETPQSVEPGYLLPTAITLVSRPVILRQDKNKKELKFGGSRKPAACVFELENAGATPSKQQVVICGFHACAELNDLKLIRSSIVDCLSAADAKSGGTLPVLVGSDTNLDYNDTGNQTFYTNLKTTQGFDTLITDGAGSSLLGAPDFSGKTPKAASNAYDNFFATRLSIGKLLPPKVLNVIDTMTDTRQKNAPKTKKRKRDEDFKDSFNDYITRNTTGKGKTSGISDHLPIVGAFMF